MEVSKTIAKGAAFVSSAFASLYLASGAFAASSAQSYLDNINAGVTGGGDALENWVFDLINWAIGIAAVISVVILIASGYMYITAAGDEGKVEKATKTLTFAIVGLVICFISVILTQFVLTKIILGE